MQLRTAVYTVCLYCAACVGCHSAQTTPAQDTPPPPSSQAAAVTETPKFLFQSPSTFFNKPSGDDLMLQR
jgi:hypothetical protein